MTSSDYQPMGYCVLKVNPKTRGAEIDSITILISNRLLQMEIVVLLFGCARDFCSSRGLQHLCTKKRGGRLDGILQLGGWNNCQCDEFVHLGTGLLCDGSWKKSNGADAAFEEYCMQVIPKDRLTANGEEEAIAHQKSSETTRAEEIEVEDEDVKAVEKASKRSAREDLSEAVEEKGEKFHAGDSEQKEVSHYRGACSTRAATSHQQASDHVKRDNSTARLIRSNLAGPGIGANKKAKHQHGERSPGSEVPHHPRNLTIKTRYQSLEAAILRRGFPCRYEPRPEASGSNLIPVGHRKGRVGVNHGMPT